MPAYWIATKSFTVPVSALCAAPWANTWTNCLSPTAWISETAVTPDSVLPVATGPAISVSLPFCSPATAESEEIVNL